MSTDFTALFPDEIITMALARDIALPRGAGTFALITLDNGFDHTRPSTLGPATLSGLSGVLSTLKARAEAGEIVGVGVTGKPFIFAVGADLTGIPKVTQRDQAVAIGQLGHKTFEQLRTLPVPSSSTARPWAAAWRSRSVRPTGASPRACPPSRCPSASWA
jgi:enoyl-CoA hydratase/carnithine racemase